MEKVKYNYRKNLSSWVLRAEIGVRRLFRTQAQAVFTAASIYMAIIIIAEIFAASGKILFGAVIDAALLVASVNLYYFIKKAEIRRFILALGLVPLLRILSVAIPIPHIYSIFWYALIGLPLLAAGVIVLYKNGLPQLTRGLSIPEWIVQFMFGLIGIPLGLLAALIIPHPKPLIPNLTLGWLLFGSIVLTLSSGFAEEIIFRGLVQNVLQEIYGFLGLFITSILYTCMLLGTPDARYIVFFGLTGLLFTLWVRLSNSLWGVIFAHSMLNIFFLLLLIR